MINSSNEFANLLQSQNDNNVSFHMAKVTQVSSGKVYLTFNSDTKQREKPYKRLSSYTPAVGDIVLCAKLNDSYTILGKVV